MATIKKKFTKLTSNQITSFTKKWVNRLLWFGCIWITWSYILASFGRESIAEALSQTVAEVIIATVLGYLLKSFLGKYNEEKNVIKQKELGIESEEITEENVEEDL